ncbi:MAG: hypothetical protein U0936_16675 [Planctomycetaceae bacterium]
MIKRSLCVLVTLMLAGQSATAGMNLFGSIPCVSEDCCSDGCAAEAVCDANDGCADDGCGESCSTLFGNCGNSSLLDLTGLLHKSDHCFDDFISPMTNPLFFEDPRTLTEARLIFANHRLPGNLGGHSAQLYAMQLRAAINEDVSLIATKDGFIVSDNPILNDGWADIAAGLKFNLYKDVEAQQLLSAGATYEAPFGTPRALQGNGSGEFHMFTSGAAQILDSYHLISGLGLRLPADQAAESTSMYWSNHLDRRIGNSKFYLLGEANWYHWLVNGGATPANFEGIDLINLGSTGVAGNDLVTLAIGGKYKPSGNTEIGIAWEVPASNRQDIMLDRLTVDWIIRY